MLAALAGVPIDAKQVERTADPLGHEVADNDRAVTETEPPPATDRAAATTAAANIPC